MHISLSSFAPESLVSRDGFGSSPVPRQRAHLHTQAESGAYLRDSSRAPRRHTFIYLNRHTIGSQSRVNRVMQLRGDGVHCRESAGTGPVNSKRVLRWQVTMGSINMRLSFPHPLLVWSGHVESTGMWPHWPWYLFVTERDWHFIITTNSRCVTV